MDTTQKITAALKHIFDTGEVPDYSEEPYNLTKYILLYSYKNGEVYFYDNYHSAHLATFDPVNMVIATRSNSKYKPLFRRFAKKIGAKFITPYIMWGGNDSWDEVKHPVEFKAWEVAPMQ